LTSVSIGVLLLYDSNGAALVSQGLRVDPKDAVPIWKQIEDGMRRLVGSGALAAGGPVPSVRELARDLGVNPMTVSKAYGRLADAGVFEIRRGEGTFVAKAPPSLGRAERTRTLKDAATRYAGTALTLGAAEAEATSAVKDAFAHLAGQTKGAGR
jgi:GntR family transcriptional regulator